MKKVCIHKSIYMQILPYLTLDANVWREGFKSVDRWLNYVMSKKSYQMCLLLLKESKMRLTLPSVS